MANKAQDYTPADLALLERIAEAMVPVLNARREAERREAERQHAEEALRESEARWRSLVENSPDVIIISDQEGTISFINRAASHPMDRMAGSNVRDWLTPATLPPLERAYQRALATGGPADYEAEVPQPDGSRRWYHSRVVRLELVGRAPRLIVFARDITDRKRTEQVLRESQAALEQSRGQLRALTASLFTAQEEERRRVSRELHDDLNQKLAMLAVEIEALGQRLPLPTDVMLRQLESLNRHVAGLSDDLHRIAYQLHPSVLEHLGLAVALRSYCAEVSLHHGLAVKLLTRHAPERLAEDVALCLYRVAQEALRNAARHSNARRATAALSGTRKEVRLSITDHDAGFDPAGAKAKGGLGLISMEERVRLGGGSLTVESQPGKGTRVEVRIPLPETVS